MQLVYSRDAQKLYRDIKPQTFALTFYNPEEIVYLSHECHSWVIEDVEFEALLNIHPFPFSPFLFLSLSLPVQVSSAVALSFQPHLGQVLRVSTLIPYADQKQRKGSTAHFC